MGERVHQHRGSSGVWGSKGGLILSTKPPCSGESQGEVGPARPHICTHLLMISGQIWRRAALSSRPDDFRGGAGPRGALRRKESRDFALACWEGCPEASPQRTLLSQAWSWNLSLTCHPRPPQAH